MGASGQVEDHVVAALRTRRADHGEHHPVPTREEMLSTIRLAHASAARRALRTARRVA